MAQIAPALHQAQPTHRSRVSSTSALPPHLSTSDALLIDETLFDASSTRDSISVAEDHLEDILSMPLSQELRSRRSHHQLHSDSPLSSSLYAAFVVSSTAARAPPSSSPSPSPSPSSQLVRASGENSTEVPKLVSAATKIPLGRSRSQSGVARHSSSSATRREAEHHWETLQSAPPPHRSLSRPSEDSREAPASAGMARSRTAGSLPSHLSAVDSTPLPATITHSVPPPLPTFGSKTATAPRKRAQTSNLTIRSSPSSRATSPSAEPYLPSATCSPTHRSSPSTQPTPPQNSSPAAKKPKPRRKSFSEATSYKIGEASRYDDVPKAPWLEEGPKVFRDQGSLGLKKEGRIADMVLPAVARRLEAERLGRLDASVDGLISTWDRDGQPRSVTVGLAENSCDRSGGKVPAPAAAAPPSGPDLQEDLRPHPSPPRPPPLSPSKLEAHATSNVTIPLPPLIPSSPPKDEAQQEKVSELRKPQAEERQRSGCTSCCLVM